ncbi:unnamed protein product [Closterium sp. Naga37s-1]|nr:unnamed protein product [Closterium sp. Naga37s-1]
MGALRPRFLLALVLMASLNFLAVFAALPPDGYYGESEPALKESYDQRALLEADNDASLDSVDSVDSVDLKDPRVLLAVADVAADFKGAPKKQAGPLSAALIPAFDSNTSQQTCNGGEEEGGRAAGTQGDAANGNRMTMGKGGFEKTCGLCSVV